MPATAKKVMDIAKSYIGTKEYPPYSNNVVFNTDYYGEQVSGSWYAWCCTFVWDIFRMAGASDIFYNGKKIAGCTQVMDWGVRNNLTVGLNDGKYGDLILFDWDDSGDADHIGFIEKANTDGTYTTIEGNTAIGNDSNGGEVMRRTRYKSDIAVIIRPKYSQSGQSSSSKSEKNKGGNDEVKFDEIPTVYEGCHDGVYVKMCQAGIGMSTSEIDGICGPKTAEAIRKFQRRHNLEIDGICGPKTWKSILENL